MANKYLAYNESTGAIERIEATTSSAGAGDAGEIVALDGTGRIDNTMMPVGIGSPTKSLTAGENLTAGDFINVYDDTGTPKMRKADASNGRRADGFVLAAVNEGDPGTAYLEGINTELSSLTAGTTYWLSGSVAGAATATVPTTGGHIAQELGRAVSDEEIIFKPSKPITL